MKDKSITHRGIIFGSLARGESLIRGWLDSADTRSTIACVRKLGVTVEERDAGLVVKGRGPEGFEPPEGPLDAGNSGTTMRLLAGLCAGLTFDTTITGDASLLRRPMRRIVEPLRVMDARIAAEGKEGHGPLKIEGRDKPLKGCGHTLLIPSAQVKTALLLAGLLADGPTRIRELLSTRDHSERLLQAMGASIHTSEEAITLEPCRDLRPVDLVVPVDISSASYFFVLALLKPDADLTIDGVGVNPTRAGLLRALWKMGGRVDLINHRIEGPEPVADVHVTHSSLNGITVGPAEIPSMIDELPLLALAASLAKGETLVRGADELRVKESDRISTTCSALDAIGAEIKELPDGFRIKGKKHLRGGKASSQGDHRIAMMLGVADILSKKGVEIEGREAVEISFPEFWKMLAKTVRGKHPG